MILLRQLVVVGAGGFARNALDAIEATNRTEKRYELLGFLDADRTTERLLLPRGLRLLGDDSVLRDVKADYVIAIAAPAVRARLDRYATSLGRQAATVVHPAASVSAAARVSPGAILSAGCRVASDVVVGRHFHGNFNSTLGHDVVTGDHVTVHPLAAVSGHAVLGDRVIIGTGSVVLPGVRVGTGSIVGAGAVVVRDIPPGSTVVGVPAHPVRRADG